MPTKRARFGIKFYSLCDNNGYLYNSEIYFGSKNEELDLQAKLGKSGCVVHRLLQPLLNKGYHLYLDNFYTSPALFQHLLLNDTLACGTLRSVRAKFPSSFTSEKLDRGETRFLTKDHILALRFRDKKDIYFLSTIHKPSLVSTRKRNKEGNPIVKQELINDYNLHMGGVDRNDQIIKHLSCVRKCHKWTTKVVFHFLEEAIYNAFVIHQTVDPVMRYWKFKSLVIEDLVSFDRSKEKQKSLPRKCGQHFLKKFRPQKKKLSQDVA